MAASLNLSEIEEWLKHFHSEEDSLPQDDTTLRPRYSLLCRRLAFTRRTLEILEKLDGELPDRIKDLRDNIQSIRDASHGSGSDSLPPRLRSLLQELHKLNGKLSLKASAFSDAYPHHREATLNPTFHIEGDPFEEVYGDRDPCLDSCASEDFLELFEDLDLAGKYFLMCFSVFPADTIVDKRTLAYWCMSMGVLNPSESQVERVVDMILEELVVKGFVEAKKRNFKLVGFKMCPLVRCFAVKVAERFGFYAFNDKGAPSFDNGEPSKVFLSRVGMTSSLDELSAIGDERLQKVECILNVNEPYPDFNLLHFAKMKNLSTLCLGRSSADQHIEIQSLDFLKGLKFVKKLTMLSLRGISQVFQLPDVLCKHAHVRVLDVNSCHNLEVLPEEIGLLKNLTHLDISKCYLLDRMPKGLASLTELCVLKGFLVVADEASCSFASLAGLKKLSKMSLYVHKIDFPNDHEQSVFQKFSLLRDFTIQWGGRAVTRELGLPSKVDKLSTILEEEVIMVGPGGSASSITLPSSREIGSGDKAGDISPSRRNEDIETTGVEILEEGQDVAAEVPNDARVTIEVRKADQSKSLMKRAIPRLPTIRIKKDLASESTAEGPMLGAVEKLMLQCYPQEEMPRWLVPSNVPRLKQLHIKGGKLLSFGVAWRNGASKLEMLRLNHLKELEMEMKDLWMYFPMLNRLAKVDCPKLSGFPADDDNIRLPPPPPREEVIMVRPGGSASSITLPSSREIGSGDKAGDISPSRRNKGIVTTGVEILEKGQDAADEVPNDARVAIEVRNADQSKPLKKRAFSRKSTFQKKDLGNKITAPDAMLGAVEKLVLQCYPQEEMPRWLVPKNVPRLKQLHFKGGKLLGFGVAWRNGASKLEMLRLNHLKELEMEMKDLWMYFPMLNRLAKVECPKLSGFPADDDNIRLPPPPPRGGS